VNAEGRPIDGCVCDFNHASGRVTREFAQKWDDFECLVGVHDPAHTTFATTQEWAKWERGAEVADLASRSTLSSLMIKVYDALFTQGDGRQAVRELCTLSQTERGGYPRLMQAASRLIVKHDGANSWAAKEGGLKMFISKLLAASVMSLLLSLNAYGAKVASDCPVVNIENNVFDASVLEWNSRVSIENGADDYPIVLDFYRVTKEGCRKTEFARYPIEGSAPTVESIFFMPLHGRVNVFSIVAWDINNRGDGTYGRLYQVYAYFFDKNGVLVENKRVSEDNSMTGIDGYTHGTESKFRYGTASDVKRYWRSRLR